MQKVLPLPGYTYLQMTVCWSLKDFARNIIEVFRSLPGGVKPNGISVSPLILKFGDSKAIVME